MLTCVSAVIVGKTEQFVGVVQRAAQVKDPIAASICGNAADNISANANIKRSIRRRTRHV